MLSIIYNNSNPYPFLIFRYFFQWSLGFLILGFSPRMTNWNLYKMFKKDIENLHYYILNIQKKNTYYFYSLWGKTIFLFFLSDFLIIFLLIKSFSIIDRRYSFVETLPFEAFFTNFQILSGTRIDLKFDGSSWSFIFLLSLII